MDNNRDSIIRQILTDYWGQQDFSLTPLSGDAGTRKYYRSGHKNKTVIVMDRGEPYSAKDDPFIILTDYLEKHSLPVPNVVFDRSSEGILLLDDLGDVTLQQEYENDEENALNRYYAMVFEMIVRMHESCLPSASGDNPDAFSLHFDYEKLRWELNFFLAHFVNRYKGRKLSNRETTILADWFDYICRTLEREPRVFTHRDFHSRNLMVHQGKVFLIDYQDARMGPPEYDLASLLRDAYVELPEAFISKFLSEYYNRTNDLRPPEWRRAAFSLMCIQRNIKALGTFGFQASTRANPIYIQYIPLLKRHIFTELGNLKDMRVFNDQPVHGVKEFQAIIGELID